MPKKYRIKKEAVPFILEKYATAVKDLEFWEQQGICKNALEEVIPVYIKYGHTLSETGEILGGFDGVKGEQEMKLTLVFPSVDYSHYNRYSKGRVIRELMERIQYVLNDFYLNTDISDLPKKD